ncbi:unnamed protein product [Brachionus calyciflorus]|uniref:Uncharacterized protein n=1 Tax=Brachionus calyciflorus TaxID=104777 RepID=A0A813Z9V5_9BILA|nr:unnamed protein product [Brachionus calyciflorus]
MLRALMRDNNSTRWSFGLKFVQISKNNSYHSTIQCTPYYVTLGRIVKLGLSGCNILRELLDKLSTEEDIEKI